MINANELRRGNWVNDDFYGDFQIVGLILFGDNQTAYKTLDYYPESQKVDKLNPIRLTEEWMVKFNAEKYETPHGNQYRIGNRLFVIRDGKIVDYGTSVILEFVHSFQNFMFALTKQELEIKL